MGSRSGCEGRIVCEIVSIDRGTESVLLRTTNRVCCPTRQCAMKLSESGVSLHLIVTAISNTIRSKDTSPQEDSL